MLQGCYSVCSDKQLNTDLVVRPAGRAEQLRQLAPPGQQGVQHVQAAARRSVRRHVHLRTQPTSRRSVYRVPSP